MASGSGPIWHFAAFPILTARYRSAISLGFEAAGTIWDVGWLFG